MSPRLNFPPPSRVQLDGLLGRALAANLTAHLARFIADETSPPIALFCPGHTAHNHEGDWYGEHAGKWLCAAARAAQRTGEASLTASVRRVADYLLSVQGADGYLGTYAPARRFMCRQGPGPRTWDGAPGQRTWDIWVHSYLILGLLEAGRVLAEPRYVTAARKIGDLCWQTLNEGGINITSLGNHHGLSATVLLDPAVELYLATGEEKYLDLANLILKQASESPALELLPQALADTDAALIATGKAYQLSWNLVGLAKLYRASGNPLHLQAVQRLWENIRQYHLTLGGGPWGGVAHRSREVFNPKPVFSPYGYVETCSTFSWIQLNRELLSLTGEAKYADEIEKSAYNDLLGAQAPAGDNWCYYSFPNGRRVYTTYWRCCKSSGPWALEELSAVAYSQTEEGDIAINLYGPGQATLPTVQAGLVRLEQATAYPFDGAIRLAVTPERAAQFSILVRIPGWAEQATVQINGEAPAPATAGTYHSLSRQWRAGDVITLQLPMPPKLHRQVNRNFQESRAPDGSAVSQEVLHFDYAAITRGPLVYATGLIDGFKVEETIRLPAGPDPGLLQVRAPAAVGEAPAVQLNLGYRPPLTFLPYFEAGGREDGTWRLTWLQVAPG
ncbi:MAG: glycoside hydrolase family 127 protein [bacterium]|nr:glycoside hydrolase family 127 protein [bacterium]MDI1337430.1 glycoside hydrolase family 127 protein [Lacunisphaera sp.]